MGYHPSPRPQYDGPAHIPYESVTRHLWGDAEAGRVADWSYISNESIHQLVYGMSQGGFYTHSEDFRTIFGADEVMIVLQGTLALANPQTGEVVRVECGEGVFFRKDTWHHGFNVGQGEVRVLEYFSPPPMQGTSGTYARTKPMLQRDDWIYSPIAWDKHWPMASGEAPVARTLYKVAESDLFWQLRGQEVKTLVGVYAATEHLHVGRIDLLPGQDTELESHIGDVGLYLDRGTVFVQVETSGGTGWHELSPGDGFYVPAGVVHAYHNMSDQSARIYLGVAPNA
jgi:quercetin dioxygenase-like cupin family protein